MKVQESEREDRKDGLEEETDFVKRMLRVFGYQKKYPSKAIFMNRKVSDFRPPEKEECWKEHYPDAKENIPRYSPKAKDKDINLTCYVDSNQENDS